MQRVMITGGASGIGKYLVQGYAEQGYEVFALDILPPGIERENIHYFCADLRKEEELHSCFAEIAQKYGQIDVLINNGAVSKFNKNVYELTAAEFDNVLNTNLRGAFICCKEFIAQHKQGSGRIINIAFTRYHQNEAGWEAYGASKGGIVSLTNTLCVSLSNTGITVNAISPGWIQVEDYDSLSELDHRQHPSGRVGKPQDIVNACLFLSQPKNDFINGANLIIDGGMTKRMIYFE